MQGWFYPTVSRSHCSSKEREGANPLRTLPRTDCQSCDLCCLLGLGIAAVRSSIARGGGSVSCAHLVVGGAAAPIGGGAVGGVIALVLRHIEVVGQPARHVLDLDVGVVLRIREPLLVGLRLVRGLERASELLDELGGQLIKARQLIRSVELVGALDDMDAIAARNKAAYLALREDQRGLQCIRSRRS